MIFLSLLLIGLQFLCYHFTRLQEVQECRIEDDVMSKIINSNADFTFNLYKEMSSIRGDKNILFSPLSISIAFAMLSLGAASETRIQIYNGLAFNLSEIEENEIHKGFCHLIHKLNLPRVKTQVKIGNALFFEKSLKIRRTFLESVRNLYHSEDFFTNFLDSTRAKQQINDYLTNKTSGKTVSTIRDLSEQIRMVLVNYFFFKGVWLAGFSYQLTFESDFGAYGNTTVKLKVMEKVGTYGFFHDEDLSCKVVQIPYTDNADAWFILPDEGKLKEVERSLVREDLDKWRSSFDDRKIKLRIPKFSISASSNVTDLLQRLGVANADLPEITRKLNLRISQAFHESVLVVHEDHTELSQISTRIYSTTIFQQLIELTPPPPLLIEFNRPFLMVIIDTSTGTILLMGKIVNPTRE
ncbi:alpha-1-antichymotrypsin-like [Paroedura picta]|uniref:alpha-1-antichymotrypsin-like n=1 Tax=Paroedura picta TaxID=143630 RepID=UPI00405760D0